MVKKILGVLALLALVAAVGALRTQLQNEALAQDERPSYYVVRSSKVSFSLAAGGTQYVSFPFPSMPRKNAAAGSIVAPDVFPHVVGYFSVWVKVTGSGLGTFTVTARPIGPEGAVPVNKTTTLTSGVTLNSGDWYVYDYQPVTCWGIRVDITQDGGANATVEIRLVYQ